jgi:hypothetical protein
MKNRAAMVEIKATLRRPDFALRQPLAVPSTTSELR